MKNKTEDLEIHFVYAGDYYYDDEQLISIILKGMEKYKIESVMVTTLDMWRWNLITKEKMMDFCKGEEHAKESVNDDLESMVEDIRLGKKRNDAVITYFFPELTEEELNLVEEEDNDFMYTFEKREDYEYIKYKMEESESDSLFVFGACLRNTFSIENPLPKNNGHFENYSNRCSLLCSFQYL